MAGSASETDTSQIDGTDGLVICDCGSTTFRIGVEFTCGGSNHIRVLECAQAECRKQMKVPFQMAATTDEKDGQ